MILFLKILRVLAETALGAVLVGLSVAGLWGIGRLANPDPTCPAPVQVVLGLLLLFITCGFTLFFWILGAAITRFMNKGK